MFFRGISHQAKHYYKYFFAFKLFVFSLVAVLSYDFDAYYFMGKVIKHEDPGKFEGLLSTILIVFFYMQYCLPIRQKIVLTLYFILLWFFHVAGHVGYLVGFIYEKDTYGIVCFCVWIAGSTIFLFGLIYYRVIRGRYQNIQIRNNHFFHFITQLEIILAIYITAFGTDNAATISRSGVAFFLLFDFFTEEYDRFHGLAIKFVLHIFVGTVTASIALEFFYLTTKRKGFEHASYITDVVSFLLFILFIFLQFRDNNFKTEEELEEAHKPNRSGDVYTTTLGKIVRGPDKPLFGGKSAEAERGGNRQRSAPPSRFGNSYTTTLGRVVPTPAYTKRAR